MTKTRANFWCVFFGSLVLAMAVVLSACSSGAGLSPSAGSGATATAKAAPVGTANPGPTPTATPTPTPTYTGTLVFGETSTYGGNFIQGVPAEPPLWKMIENQGLDVSAFVSPISSLLLYLDPLENKMATIAPDVAEGWQVQQNGSVIVFTLRPGVRTHSGTAATSDDVVFAFNLLKSFGDYGMTAAPTGSLIRQYMTSVEAVDPVTVRLTLSRPVNGVLFQLADRANAICSLPPSCPPALFWTTPSTPTRPASTSAFPCVALARAYVASAAASRPACSLA